MAHTLFLVIVCLTIYFYYLFITYYRLGGNIDLVAIEEQLSNRRQGRRQSFAPTLCV
jgi:hypothetical protein